MAGLVDVAVADADLVARLAQFEALAEAGFQAAHPVFAGRQGEVLALVEVAAAQGLGEEAGDVEFLLGAGGEFVAGAGQGAAAPEFVEGAGGLVGIVAVVRHAQAAGHVGLAVVVLGDGREAVEFVGLEAALEDQVVDPRVAVFAPVAATDAGVEQSAA
ncbi:hypothetical protein D3C81_1603850 [compost metagenome]